MNNVTSDQHDEKQPSSENWNENLQRTNLGHFLREECENMEFSRFQRTFCYTWPCACFFISFLYIVFSLKKIYKSKKSLQVASIWYYLYVWNSMFVADLFTKYATRFFYFVWKETTHKPLKVAAAKTLLSSVYVIGATCFDVFILCDNWKTLLFIIVCRYSEIFLAPMFLSIFLFCFVLFFLKPVF